jgi:hypothetical protein
MADWCIGFYLDVHQIGHLMFVWFIQAFHISIMVIGLKAALLLKSLLIASASCLFPNYSLLPETTCSMSVSTFKSDLEMYLLNMQSNRILNQARVKSNFPTHIVRFTL